MDYSKYNLTGREDRKQLIDEIYTEKHYCDNCLHLKIHSPYRGYTTADINVWRDLYKCECEYLRKMWLNNHNRNIPQDLLCILLELKEERPFV